MGDNYVKTAENKLNPDELVENGIFNATLGCAIGVNKWCFCLLIYQ